MLWMSSTVSCSGAEKPLLLLLLCIIAFLPTYSAEARWLRAASAEALVKGAYDAQKLARCIQTQHRLPSSGSRGRGGRIKIVKAEGTRRAFTHLAVRSGVGHGTKWLTLESR